MAHLSSIGTVFVMGFRTNSITAPPRALRNKNALETKLTAAQQVLATRTTFARWLSSVLKPPNRLQSSCMTPPARFAATRLRCAAKFRSNLEGG